MKMPDWIKQFLPPAKATKDEARHLRHELKNSIQAIQGGNRVLKTYTGMVELNRRKGQP